MLGRRPIASSRWMPTIGLGAVARCHLEARCRACVTEIASAPTIDGDALVLEDVLDGGRHVLVLAGGQPRPLLDDGDVGAEPPVHLRELQRDVAAADDDEMLWQRVEFEDADVGQVVDVGSPGMSGTTARPPTLRKIRSASRTWSSTRSVCGSGEAGVAADQGAAVHALEPGLDAVAVVEHDVVLARLDLCHVDGDVAGADAEIGPAARDVRGVRAGDQRLGRDAAGVDAGAADQLAFDHRDGLPGRGQPAGQRRPGLAGADDDRVEAFCAARQPCHDDRGKCSDREAADDRDGVLDQRDRQVAPAVGRDEPLARLVAAERAEHGADQTPGADDDPRRRVNRTPWRGPRRENAPVISRATNCTGYSPARRLRQLIGDQFAERQNGQHRDGDRMRHPLQPMCRRG